MENVCPICNKLFKRLENLTRHLNKKVCEKKNFCCKYCKHKFSHKTNLYRHVREDCLMKKQSDAEKDNIYKRLLELEKENEELKNKLNTKGKKKIINNVNNATTINGDNNVLILVKCGCEDIGKIDKNELMNVFRSGYRAALKMTETVHFNSKYPEFQNVYISNMKDKYAMAYNGSTWSLTTKTDVIDKLYDNSKSYIEDNIDDFRDSLTKGQKASLERYLNTDDNDDKIKAIKEEIKLLLYNKREIPMQTKDATTKMIT